MTRLRPPNRRDIRAVGSLAALCTLAYLPTMLAVAHGAWPFAEDSIAAFGVWREFARGALSRGTLPLWNPHMFCGEPFMSNGQTSLLYPPNLLYWLLPIRPALLLDAVLHNIWLAVGAYVLARSLRLSHTAAWLAALCIALSGAVAGHIFNGHMTWHAARGYLPWELWSLLCLLRTGRLRYGCYLAGCFGLQLASGYPPVSLLSAALCAGLLIAWIVTHAWYRVITSSRAAVLPRGWPRLAAITVLLTCLLVAVCVLPLREVSSLSVHGTGLPFSLAMFGSGNWHTIVRLLVPEFFGGNRELQWSVIYVVHEEGAYIGLLPLLLAITAPWLARRKGWPLPRAVPWLWLLLPAALVLAMGENTPAYPWLFRHSVLFKMLRVPVRWMDLWCYPAALLAAYSYDQTLHRTPARDRRQQYLAGIVAVLTAALLALLLYVWRTPAHARLWMETAQWNVTRSGADQVQAATRLRDAALDATVMAVGLGGATAILLLRLALATTPRQRRTRRRVLLALIACDLTGVFWRSSKSIAPVPLQHDVFWPVRLTNSYDFPQRWDTDVSLNSMNQGLPLGIDLFGGYDTMGSRRFFDFAAAVEGEPVWLAAYQPSRDSPLLRVAGRTHSLTQTFFADRPTAWRLVPRPGSWPRAYLTRRVVRLPAPQQLVRLTTLAATPMGARDVPVVLAPHAFPGIASTSLRPRETVTVARRALNIVALHTNTSTPAVLVVGEAWYPGWRAWVNGVPAPLETGNYLFRAVGVPAGSAEVRMVYEPATYRLALFLTLCGLLLAGAMAVMRTSKCGGIELR